MALKNPKLQSEWRVEGPVEIGQLVRQLRTEAGLTLRQAAAFCGVNYRFLVELEHGKESIRVSHLFKVLKAFGIVMAMRRQGLK